MLERLLQVWASFRSRQHFRSCVVTGVPCVATKYFHVTTVLCFSVVTMS